MGKELAEKFVRAVEIYKQLSPLESDLGKIRKNMTKLGGRYKEEGLLVNIPNYYAATVDVVHNGQRFSLYPLKDEMITITPFDGGSFCDTHYKVVFDNFIRKLPDFIGKESEVYVEISDDNFRKGKYVDIGLFIKKDSLNEFPTLAISNLFFSDGIMRILYEDPVLAFREGSIKRNEALPYIELYADEKVDFNSELVNILIGKSKRVNTLNEFNELKFELENQMAINNFIELTEIGAKVSQARNYTISSLNFRIPLKKLRMLNAPPSFNLKHNGEIDLEYKSKSTHREESLEMTIPINNLEKAAYFLSETIHYDKSCTGEERRINL